MAALIYMTHGIFPFHHQPESISQIKHLALAFGVAIRFQLANIFVIHVEQRSQHYQYFFRFCFCIAHQHDGTDAFHIPLSRIECDVVKIILSYAFRVLTGHDSKPLYVACLISKPLNQQSNLLKHSFVLPYKNQCEVYAMSGLITDNQRLSFSLIIEHLFNV